MKIDKDIVFTLKLWGIWMLLYLLWMIFIPSPCHASDFTDYINQPIQTQETKEGLRVEWNNVLGFDAFSGYFKLKDMEDTFREYFSVNAYGFKGKLKIADNYRAIEYKFKLEF